MVAHPLSEVATIGPETTPFGTRALRLPAVILLRWREETPPKVTETVPARFAPAIVIFAPGAAAAFEKPDIDVATVCTHPVPVEHVSVVQGFPSLQSVPGPPTHAPAVHASSAVQGFPSEQAAVLFVWAQPVAWMHVSVVQPFPSLQSGAGPPVQAPFEQASLVVHALPSEQGSVLFAWAHPVAGLHASVVHPFASSQLSGAPPTQAPFEQASFSVH